MTGYASSDNGTWGYTYDRADRMTQASLPGGATTYTYGYDGAGNRTLVQQTGHTDITTTLDAAGYLAHADQGSNRTNYTTDASGRLTAVAAAQGQNPVEGTVSDTYTYDTWGRLTQAQPSSGTVTYQVDPIDRTILRTAGSSSTTNTYVGTSEQLATSRTGLTTTSYGWTSGGPYAQKTAGVGNVTSYVLTDLHDDVVGLVSAAGAMAGTQGYGPWGDRRSGDTSGAQSALGFQSDPTDTSTALVDMVARNYEPSLGRFDTQDTVVGDPLNPTSLNQFTYGFDDPATHTDPNGLCPAGEVCVDGIPIRIWRSNPRLAERNSISFDMRNWGENPAAQALVIQMLWAPPPPPAPPAPAVAPPSSGCHGLFGCIFHAASAATGFVARHAETILTVATIAVLAATGVGIVAAIGVAALEGGTMAALYTASVIAAGAAGEAAVATAPEDDAMASQVAQDAEGAAASCNSFVAGTPVLLASGKSIPIQRVKVGTRVMTVDQYHPYGARVGSKVVGLIRHADAELYRLRVDGTTIEATGNHPFFVKSRGWVTVRDLRRGMELEEYSGKLVRLTNILREATPPLTVYNFTVARTHTYFAGTAQVLVHNCNPIAARIAAGHAWDKHANEFPELTTRDDLASHIDDVMSNPDETRALTAGRTAFWRDSVGTVVIHDPSSPDLGTAFRPKDGYAYFRGLM